MHRPARPLARTLLSTLLAALPAALLAGTAAAAGEIPPVLRTPAQGTKTVVAVDRDGDGRSDLLVASYEGGGIVWYDGRAGGAPTLLGRELGTVSILPADINGDGRLDVLSATADGRLYWHEQTDEGGWIEHMISRVPGVGRSIAAGDVDGDGDLDVLSVTSPGGILWHENTDVDGRRWERHRASQVSPRSVLAVDVDDDGDADLLTAAKGGQRLGWIENLYAGARFTSQAMIAESELARFAVYAADGDGDGAIDALSASPGLGISFTVRAGDGAAGDRLELMLEDASMSLRRTEDWLYGELAPAVASMDAIHLDDHSGVFALGDETRLTAVGTLQIPALRAGAEDHFLVLEMQRGGSPAVPSFIRITRHGELRPAAEPDDILAPGGRRPKPTAR